MGADKGTAGIASEIPRSPLIRAPVIRAPYPAHERHRHHYEFNNQYRQQFAAHGLVVSGTSPDGELVEVIELRDHAWFLAVQCHPEFKSKPTAAHPLFRGFMQASLARREGKKKDAGRLRAETPAAARS